jgi:phage terminase small subunit
VPVIAIFIEEYPMGERGPKPLPKNVHMLRGNASKLPVHALSGAIEPEIEIPGCPKHLLPEARKEWKRITPELAALGLVSRIDRSALALYCQEWAWLVWHEQMLQREVARAAEQRLQFDAAEQAKAELALARGESYIAQSWTGGDGFQIPTPNGSFTYNPHWVGRNKAAAALDKFLASFGLSPSSRGRVTPSSRQAYLPGLEPKGGFDAL